jgi:hypothetical protein
MQASVSLLPYGLAAMGMCLSAQALAAEKTEPYPTVPVLDAFRAACSDLSTLDAAAAKAKQSGWRLADDPDQTPVGEMVRSGYEQQQHELQGVGHVMSQPSVYSRAVAGETLYLMLSGVEVADMTLIGCRGYDPDEVRNIDPKDAERWMGRAPDLAVDKPEATRLKWEPGLTPEQNSFEIYHVPAGSPAITITKFAGIAFKADQVGTVQH